MKYSKYNIVIIGSGISGLYLANKLANCNNFNDGVLLVTKKELFSGSSALAQGGIVSVIPEINKQDSIESHIKDTIDAGCGLNDLNIVKFVSENSAAITQELIEFGVEFDKIDNNTFNFTLEGAHSHPRILHAQGDSTGKIIEQVLCERIKKSNNIDIYDNTFALELLVDKSDICRGIVLYNSKSRNYEVVYSNAVVLATGGIGQIYKNTTNPETSTADGIAIASNAGVELENMEFVQFHPTALYCKDQSTMPLVSESTRGEGAKLVNIKGEYFAKKYHNKADLAPRDVVARAILNEIQSNNDQYVNLDISQIGIQNFKNRFPTITELCDKNNIDLSNGLIAVTPAQHYFMGGIKVDINSKTSMNNLYAIGECASTGLHGANRLASNSLLECCVFAKHLSEYLIKNLNDCPNTLDEKIKKTLEKYDYKNIPDDSQNKVIDELFLELKNVMTNYSGIIRNEKSLNIALNAINEIEFKLNQSDIDEFISKIELKNAIVTAKHIIAAGLNRKESIGAHYRNDHIPKSISINEDLNKNGEISIK